MRGCGPLCRDLQPHVFAAQVTDRVRPCGMGAVFSCGGVEEEGYTHAASAHCEWLCPVLDGVARLTNGQMNAAGSLLLTTPQHNLAPPPREFNLTFDVLVGFAAGELEGNGRITINLGELPRRHFGLEGLSLGLSVHLFGSRDGRIEVWLRGALLKEATLGTLLRVGAWLPCAVEVAHGRLSVSLGRSRLVDKLVLPGWAAVATTPRAHATSSAAPAPSWRFGFSALAGSLSRDVYALDNVVLHSASLIGRIVLPMAIALNGQQFITAPEPFRYYGPADWPRIDHDDMAPAFRNLGLSPTSGPVDGGTVLRVAVRAQR